MHIICKLFFSTIACWKYIVRPPLLQQLCFSCARVIKKVEVELYILVREALYRCFYTSVSGLSEGLVPSAYSARFHPVSPINIPQMKIVKCLMKISFRSNAITPIATLLQHLCWTKTPIVLRFIADISVLSSSASGWKERKCIRTHHLTPPQEKKKIKKNHGVGRTTGWPLFRGFVSG